MKNRDIRHAVFKNELLGVLPGDAFQLFCGLWCYADREGRFEWRPARIKAEIFPYRTVKIDDLLKLLVENRFVHRYSVDGRDFGWVVNFGKHQFIQKNEAASTFPEPPDCDKLLLMNNKEETLSFEKIHDGTKSEVRHAGEVQGKGSAGNGKCPGRTPRSENGMVLLSDDEFAKLESKYGEKLPIGIARLDDWIYRKKGQLDWFSRKFHSAYTYLSPKSCFVWREDDAGFSTNGSRGGKKSWSQYIKELEAEETTEPVK